MRFDRFERLVGKKAVQELKHKRVVIFGLGGVGSYAVEGIARSGIGTIILCDYDKIEITNINRQIIALSSTIGEFKTDLLENRILDINPKAKVLKYTVKAEETIIEEILDMKPDFIVDAIDDVSAKVYLIKTAIKRDIPIISSMGFANKLHPEKIEISTLKNTSVCPLAKVMRKKLREINISLNFPVVYSKEKPKENISLASSAYTPSVAGLMIASYVINRLVGGEST